MLMVQIVKLFGVLLWVGEFAMYWRTVDTISDDKNYRPILQAFGIGGGLLSVFGNILINRSMCVLLDTFLPCSSCCEWHISKQCSEYFNVRLLYS